MNTDALTCFAFVMAITIAAASVIVAAASSLLALTAWTLSCFDAMRGNRDDPRPSVTVNQPGKVRRLPWMSSGRSWFVDGEAADRPPGSRLVRTPMVRRRQRPSS